MAQGPNRPPPAPPTYLLEGQYIAVEHLATGHTSEVFSGTDTWSGQLVAIRMLREDRRDKAAMFRRMAERLFGLASARIVRPLVVGDDRDGQPFLVTELLVGRGLSKVGKVRWEVGCEIVRQAALAVVEMHLNRLHHGALRDASFFVASSNEGGSRVKLLDLGTGDRAATEAGDVRALAGVLHRLLLGRPALPASARQAGTSLGATIPDAPPELEDLLLQWLVAGTELGGPITAAELAGALRELLDPTREPDDRGRDSATALPAVIVLPKSSVRIDDDGGVPPSSESPT
jgi:serine/threonine protein kinase